MSRTRYNIYEEVYPYFITSSIRYRLPVFSVPAAARIVFNAIMFLQEKKEIKLFAFVIMENHLHLVLQGHALARKIGSFKSYTARTIIDLFEENGHYNILNRLKRVKLSHKTDRSYQLWEEGYHPKQLVSDNMMFQKIRYIHENPVKRGYVDEPEHWRYSSARNYAGMKGVIPITLYRGRGG